MINSLEVVAANDAHFKFVISQSPAKEVEYKHDVWLLACVLLSPESDAGTTLVLTLSPAHDNV